MAEIEYFVDPDKKEITKFSSVEDTICRLYSRDIQMAGEPAVMMSLKEAYAKALNNFFYPLLLNRFPLPTITSILKSGSKL